MALDNNPVIAALQNLRVRRLEDILPDLRKHRIEKSDKERIELLELTVSMLKNRIHILETKDESA